MICVGPCLRGLGTVYLQGELPLFAGSFGPIHGLFTPPEINRPAGGRGKKPFQPRPFFLLAVTPDIQAGEKRAVMEAVWDVLDVIPMVLTLGQFRSFTVTGKLVAVVSDGFANQGGFDTTYPVFPVFRSRSFASYGFFVTLCFTA